jgi:SAM-dependent methyltransferase
MDYEKSLVDRLPEKGGRLLLLGMGGGREAIPLAEMGFDVTGIDHAPALVARGLQLAADRGVKIEGLVQDISNLQLPSSRYDVVFFSRSMYSLVPSRKRRVHMLQRIREALKPEGSVLCQFHWDPSVFPGRKSLLIRRATACLTLGNFSYEPGDILWGGAEFVHAFGSEREVRSEFELAGFETSYWALFENWRCGGAILRLRDAERSRE